MCAGVNGLLLLAVMAAPPGETQVDPIPILVRGLKANDPEVRKDAAYELYKLGPNAKAAIPALVNSLGDEDWQVGYAAATALGKIGQASVPALRKALSSRDAQTRRLAADALGRIGMPAKEAVLDFVRLLSKEEDKDVREEAIMALASIEDPRAIPTLIQLARNGKRRSERRCCVRALGGFGDKGKEVVPFLIEIIKKDVKDIDEDGGFSHELNRDATNSLQWIGAPAVPALIAVLKDRGNTDDLRSDVALILSNLGMIWGADTIKDAVPALIDVFKKKERKLFFYSARALGFARPHAKDAIVILTQAVRAMDTRDRIKVAWAMFRNDPKNRFSIPILVEAVDSAKRNDRSGAAGVLEEMGSHAAPAVPALRKALKDKDGGVRRMAARALGAIGKPAKDAIPDLKIATEDVDRRVREDAQEALESIQD